MHYRADMNLDDLRKWAEEAEQWSRDTAAERHALYKKLAIPFYQERLANPKLDTDSKIRARFVIGEMEREINRGK